MVELTESLQHALDVESVRPLRLVDPRDHQAYVLLPIAEYERIRTVFFDDGLSPEQTAVLVEDAMREYDSDDPLLASYQTYQRDE